MIPSLCHFTGIGENDEFVRKVLFDKYIFFVIILLIARVR